MKKTNSMWRILWSKRVPDFFRFSPSYRALSRPGGTLHAVENRKREWGPKCETELLVVPPGLFVPGIHYRPPVEAPLALPPSIFDIPTQTLK